MVKCVNQECDEFDIPKATDGIPDGLPVTCGWCGEPCEWPTPPAAEQDAD